MAKRAENEGFRILDDHVCEGPHRSSAPSGPLLRQGQNEGMRVVNEFVIDLGVSHGESGARGGSEVVTLDTLKIFLAQHEQKLHGFVNRLQTMIDELTKQNAELKASLMEPDPVAGRYHLNGPPEDEI